MVPVVHLSNPFARALGVVLSGFLASAAAGPPPVAGDGPGVRFEPPGAGYHDEGAVGALVASWIAADPVRVRAVDLGLSSGGRAVPALAFESGAVPPASHGEVDRRTVLLVGGLDGRSQSGAEAVLRATHALLARIDHLPLGVEVVAVPWGSPDGLARVAGGGEPSGRDATPVDDDEDGRVDEDGGDDVDGDGRTLEMLLPDPDGAWVLGEDPRFLAPAGPGDAPRYARTVEGRDDDGDGLFNEDGAGGLDLDRQFPVGWDGPGPAGAAGERPLDAPLARRLAALVLERDVAVAFVFQGAHGGVSLPRDRSPERLDVHRRLALAFARSSGRPERDAIVPDDGRAGRFVDWLHAVPGVTAVEVAVWGPDVVGRDGRPVLTPPDAAAPPDHAGPALRGGLPLSGAQRRWARWLDDVRGGAGFAEWHPVDLGGGLTGLVGGWAPRTRLDPPEESLQPALAGVAPFVQEVVTGLPTLSVELVRVERSGDLVEIDVRVTNRGALPTGLGDVATDAAGAIDVRLEAACDAALLAGPPVQRVAGLGGRETSRTLRWIVATPSGASLRVTASSRRAGVARREVRP